MSTFWLGYASGTATWLLWFVGLPWLAERMGVWDRTVAPFDGGWSVQAIPADSIPVAKEGLGVAVFGAPISAEQAFRMLHGIATDFDGNDDPDDE